MGGHIMEEGKAHRTPNMLRQLQHRLCFFKLQNESAKWAAGTLGLTTGILDGLSVGYVSAGMDSLREEHKAGVAPFSIDSADIGTFGSAMSLGCMVAAPVSAYLARRYGRKIPAILSLIPYIMGWLLIAFPVNFLMMVAGQGLCGFAISLRSACARMYLAEISHPRCRAQLVSGMMVFSGAAQVAVYLAALILNWQKLALACAVVPFLAAIFVEWRIPESHVWLLSRGRVEDARKSMQWTLGDEYKLDQDFEEAVKHQNDSQQAVTHWKDLLGLRYLKPIFILSGFLLLRQFTGGNAINMFMSQIFRHSDSMMDVRYCIIALGTVSFICCSFSGVVMDKLGRRKSVMISGMMMGLAEMVVGAYFYLEEQPSTRSSVEEISWLLLVTLSLSAVGYTIGLFTLKDVIMGEVIPLQIKNEANAILSFVNNGLAYLSLLAFQGFLTSVQPSGTFWIFGSCCFMLVGFFMAFVPETKGKSLGHIERTLSGMEWTENPTKSRTG